MNWLKRSIHRLRLRKWTRKMGPLLAKNYGRQRSYTPAQIRRTALGLGLSEAAVIHLYACYLSEKEFRTLHAGSPHEHSYHDLRDNHADASWETNSSFDPHHGD